VAEASTAGDARVLTGSSTSTPRIQLRTSALAKFDTEHTRAAHAHACHEFCSPSSAAGFF
jgi:hypothetical protein